MLHVLQDQDLITPVFIKNLLIWIKTANKILLKTEENYLLKQFKIIIA